MQSMRRRGAAAFHAWQEVVQLFALLVKLAVDAGVGGEAGGGSAALSSGAARSFFEGHGLACGSDKNVVLRSAVMGLLNSMVVLQRVLCDKLPLRQGPTSAILAGCPAAASTALDTAELLLRLAANWAQLGRIVKQVRPPDDAKLSSVCSVQCVLLSARYCLELLWVAFQDRPLSEALLPGTAGEQLKRVASLVATAVKAGRCMGVIPEQARAGAAGCAHPVTSSLRRHAAACALLCMQLPGSHMNATRMHRLCQARSLPSWLPLPSPPSCAGPQPQQPPPDIPPCSGLGWHPGPSAAAPPPRPAGAAAAGRHYPAPAQRGLCGICPHPGHGGGGLACVAACHMAATRDSVTMPIVQACKFP